MIIQGADRIWSLEVRVVPAYKPDNGPEQSAYIVVSDKYSNRILVQGSLRYPFVRVAARQILLAELAAMIKGPDNE